MADFQEPINLRKIIYRELHSPKRSMAVSVYGAGTHEQHPSLHKVDLNFKEISGQDYTGLKVVGGRFVTSNFNQLDLEGAVFDGCEFVQCDFDYCEGAELVFHNCTFDFAVFRYNEWYNLKFVCCTFKDCNFDPQNTEPMFFEVCRFMNGNHNLLEERREDSTLPKHTFKDCSLVDAVGKKIDI